MIVALLDEVQSVSYPNMAGVFTGTLIALNHYREFMNSNNQGYFQVFQCLYRLTKPLNEDGEN
jgi:hypothetical protein